MGLEAQTRYDVGRRGRTETRLRGNLEESLGSTPRRQDAHHSYAPPGVWVSEDGLPRTYASSVEFSRHSDNLRAVEKGLTQVERLHKQAIRASYEPSIDTLARLQYLTIGIMAEARLRKIAADPNGFNDRERELIRQTRSQLDKWLLAVELAFRRHHRVPIHLDVDAHTTSAVTEGQYRLIRDLLRNDLASVIEDRNKTAHAQWLWLLNSKETNFTGPAAAPYNYSALLARSNLIRSIGDLINTLVLSEVTFQRDYAKYVGLINVARGQLDGSYYPTFVARMMANVRAPSTSGPAASP
jgi:hypothetical protein